MLLGLLTPTLLLAAGIQVSPTKLDVSLKPNTTLDESLTVANPTADVQIFEVYADDFKQNLQFSPASFTLESGGQKTVQLKILGFGFNNNQTLVTTVSVVGKPLAEGAGVKVGTGVKIPTTVRFSENAKAPLSQNKIIGLILALIAILLLVYALTGKKPTAR